VQQEALFRIRSLWKLDHGADEALREIRRLADRVRSTTAAIIASKELVQSTAAELEAVTAAERKLNRRMEEYILRRDKTRRMLDEGQVSDFITASRQLDQCTMIADDLELEVLEHMERMETLSEQLSMLKLHLAGERVADTEARAEYHERAPVLKAEAATLQAGRGAILALLFPEQQRGYATLRRYGLEPLTNIIDGTCKACHRRVPPQAALEVQSGKRIHTCRGCGRFFFEIEEAPDPDDAQ